MARPGRKPGEMKPRFQINEEVKGRVITDSSLSVRSYKGKERRNWMYDVVCLECGSTSRMREDQLVALSRRKQDKPACKHCTMKHSASMRDEGEEKFVRFVNEHNSILDPVSRRTMSLVPRDWRPR